MALNLHEIAGNALTVVNDWVEMVFTMTDVRWDISSRDPIKTKSTITLRGKIQPASAQDLHELGFNLAEYEYFKAHVTGTPTQLDRLRQRGCDTFKCGDYEYKIVGKMPWDDGGWRKFFAYRMKYMGEGTDETESSV